MSWMMIRVKWKFKAAESVIQGVLVGRIVLDEVFLWKKLPPIIGGLIKLEIIEEQDFVYFCFRSQ